MKKAPILLGALVAAGACVFLALRAPSDDAVCAHTVALHRELRAPRADDDASQRECHRTLTAQSGREMPWTVAAQKRCYVAADSPSAFHECGGELCHFGE